MSIEKYTILHHVEHHGIQVMVMDEHTQPMNFLHNDRIAIRMTVP